MFAALVASETLPMRAPKKQVPTKKDQKHSIPGHNLRQDTDLERALALSRAAYQQELIQRNPITLPEELYAAYVPLAEEAREQGGLTSSTIKAIKALVTRYFPQGTTAQKETIATILCEDITPTDLQRCDCDDAPLNKRIELILDMKQRLSSHPRQMPVVHTSFGSGQLLQDFWAIRELQKDGFKHITVNFIDSVFNPMHAAGELSETHQNLNKALIEFSKKTGLKVNRFDETHIAFPGVINVFSNANDYIRVCLEQPSLKSTLLTLIDPLEISDATNDEEVHILSIAAIFESDSTEDFSAQDQNSYAEDDLSCEECDNMIISLANRAHPRTYVQSHLLEDELSMEIIRKITELTAQATCPVALKAQIEEQYPLLQITTYSNPLITYRDMIELTLVDEGFAYIIADEIDPITRQKVKIISRQTYQQAAYNQEAFEAELHYVEKDNYIAL